MSFNRRSLVKGLFGATAVAAIPSVSSASHYSTELHNKKELNKYGWNVGTSLNPEIYNIIQKNITIKSTGQRIITNERICPLPFKLLYSYLMDKFDDIDMMHLPVPCTAHSPNHIVPINGWSFIPKPYGLYVMLMPNGSWREYWGMPHQQEENINKGILFIGDFIGRSK
jgi:hypothetical protein